MGKASAVVLALFWGKQSMEVEKRICPIAYFSISRKSFNNLGAGTWWTSGSVHCISVLKG